MRSCFLTRFMRCCPRIVYPLPFIRNHVFARYGTKGFIFKAFQVFSSRLHGRLKKETVNLSLKNANLCLRFALVHFILTNHFAAKAFSLTTVTRFLRSDRESGKHLLTACSYLFDNFGLRYKVHDCYRYDISYHIQD